MNDIAPEIVQRAKDGDEDAQRAILETLHRPVIATVYRFVGSRYRAEVEDVAQEVFVKVFRAIDRFDPSRGVKFTTWVYTFVRNHCFDFLKRRRLPVVSLVPREGEEDRAFDFADDAARRPSDALENSELGGKIEEALAALGPDQRLAFVLREYEGLDYGEIADVTGVSEGTVKSRLHRAKEALRHRLSRYVGTGT